MATERLTYADWVAMGREHSQAKRWGEARQCFEEALRFNPKNSVAQKRLHDLPILQRLREATYVSGCLVAERR